MIKPIKEGTNSRIEILFKHRDLLEKSKLIKTIAYINISKEIETHLNTNKII